MKQLEFGPPSADEIEPTLRFRPVLVPFYRAVEALGARPEVVFDWVDSGRLVWVWDISCPIGGKRNLRFWLAELLGANVCRLSREDAISRVIACSNPRLRMHQVEQILFTGRNVVHRLLGSGELNGYHGRPNAWVATASLADFLKRRLL